MCVCLFLVSQNSRNKNKNKTDIKIKRETYKENVDKCGKIFKRVRDPLDLNYYVYFGTKWH